MIIEQKLGNIYQQKYPEKKVDFVDLEWYEVKKRILHKTSRSGVRLKMKFLNVNPNLIDGDILLITDDSILCVHIVACECLIIDPRNSQELAAACFEIGNRHATLYYQNNQLMVAFEQPMFNYFKALDFQVKKDIRKLNKPLKTSVTPHGESSGIFTKIMQLTNAQK